MACRDSYNSSLWDGRDEANNFRRVFKSFVESVNEEELARNSVIIYYLYYFLYILSVTFTIIIIGVNTYLC